MAVLKQSLHFLCEHAAKDSSLLSLTAIAGHALRDGEAIRQHGSQQDEPICAAVMSIF